MPRKVRDEFMRHENTAPAITEEEETFSDDRESAIVSIPRGKKGKRSVEDMLASMANPEAQALYAMERIASAEDAMAKVLKLVMPETLAIILKRRPTLKRYAPEETIDLDTLSTDEE